jgi:hypothetical protein
MPKVPRMLRAPRPTRASRTPITWKPKNPIMFSSSFKIFLFSFFQNYLTSGLFYHSNIFLVSLPFSFILCSNSGMVTFHCTVQKRPQHASTLLHYRNSLSRDNSRFFLTLVGLILSHQTFIFLST